MTNTIPIIILTAFLSTNWTTKTIETPAHINDSLRERTVNDGVMIYNEIYYSKFLHQEGNVFSKVVKISYPVEKLR